MIAVTGATGQLGGLIVEGLKARGQEVVALARDPAKGAGLGVPVRRADYDRPETLGPALAGVETLMLVSGSEVGSRARQHRAVIEAAVAAGVTRIVYTSLLHANRSAISLAPEHVATEAMLAATGLPVTILRNGWYAENYASAVAAGLAHGAMIGAAGEGRISAAPRAEMAEAAVAVLTTPGHEGRTYEVAGDAGFTLAELAAEASRQAGRAVLYQDMAEADYAQALAGAGLPEPVAAMLAGWDTAIRGGDLEENGGDLARLLGRPTASLPAMVASLLPT